MILETDLPTLLKMRASWEEALMHAPCVEMVENIKAQLSAMDAAIRDAQKST